MELELDWESAFCKNYIDLWFSLQNRHLRDKGKMKILDSIHVLTRSIEILIGRKIEKFEFPDYTPFIGNKLQTNTIEYIYYKYVKRLMKLKEIIEMMEECKNDLLIYLKDPTYLDKKYIVNSMNISNKGRKVIINGN